MILDEAHHMLPADWTLPSADLTASLENIALITVHPNTSPRRLSAPSTPSSPSEPRPAKYSKHSRRRSASPLRNCKTPTWPLEKCWPGLLKTGQLIASASASPKPNASAKANYSAGDLGEDKSFYFRGPEDKLNLRAQNLTMFLQLAGGVDDDTWNYHLARGDYSRWFREAIKDEELAQEASQLEHNDSLNAHETREQIKSAVERRYTAPV